MKPDDEAIRKYAALAQTFAAAMGTQEEVTVTLSKGSQLVGRAVRRATAPKVGEAGLTLGVLTQDGEQTCHLSDVRAIKGADA